MNEQQLSSFLSNAIKEDIGSGDHSSLACIPEKQRGKAHLVLKEAGVIAGIEVSKRVFQQLDPTIEFTPYMDDGDSVENGDIGFLIEGDLHQILGGERIVLNILQRMSGIATHTRAFVNKVQSYPAVILDTRKTTPGMRFLEKRAVKLGGGENHRMGLYDMIMLKDNHIDYAGGIQQAIEKTAQYLKRQQLDLKVVIEARSLACVEEIIATGKVHRILLDNMSPQALAEAVNYINGRFETEASGGIHLENVTDYARTGVDYISLGCITDQSNNMDMSLKAVNE